MRVSSSCYVPAECERLSHKCGRSPKIDGEFLSQSFRIMVALAFSCEIRNLHETLQRIVDPVRQFVRHFSGGGSFRLLQRSASVFVPQTIN